MDDVGEFLTFLLGLGREAKDVSLWQMLVRALVMFIAVLVMLRSADKRFLARRNALDILLGFFLGSMLSRAVNGSAPFFQTVAAGFFVVALHRTFSWLAFRAPWLGKLFKGEPDLLVEEGQLRPAALARHQISQDDLEEDLRLKKVFAGISRVKRAQLERNGEISVEEKRDY